MCNTRVTPVGAWFTCPPFPQPILNICRRKLGPANASEYHSPNFLLVTRRVEPCCEISSQPPDLGDSLPNPTNSEFNQPWSQAEVPLEGLRGHRQSLPQPPEKKSATNHKTNPKTQTNQETTPPPTPNTPHPNTKRNTPTHQLAEAPPHSPHPFCMQAKVRV